VAKAIMVQGTMSSAGKSLLCTGLCRAFKRDGHRVAPFKSQNMALNSFITKAGLEMGRAQAVQAEAAGVEPDVRMNPILLKPVTNMGSQVIVNGRARGNLSAREYYAMKRSLVPDIMASYDSLSAEYDIIVLEGAGSPAEINLNKDDFVNMGMARMARAPVLLVGDIDRGGVFAQLYGTVALLDGDERGMVKATVINKFRGDINLLGDGLSMLEDLTHVPVAGVLPCLDVDIDDEDSLADRLTHRRPDAALDIAVARFPRLSNFTDFAALEATGGVGVRYVRSPKELGAPDLIVLPGTESIMADLKWLRQCGLEAAIKKLGARDVPVFGIGGGYHMLGESLSDAESGDRIDGMGLLPVTTELTGEARRGRVAGKVLEAGGALAALSGVEVMGYEIIMGRATPRGGARPLARLEGGAEEGCQKDSVYGTNLHGFFDSAACREALFGALCRRKGVSLQTSAFDLTAYRESQYDALARAVREHLDMGLIYRILEAGL
jgi:adenosylcobyric acid synthase